MTGVGAAPAAAPVRSIGWHRAGSVPGVLLWAETTYGCIAKDMGLPDPCDGEQPGRVDLVPDSDPVAPLGG